MTKIWSVQAALAYDIAACKFRGADATTNFDPANYAQELAAFDNVRIPIPIISLPDALSL